MDDTPAVPPEIMLLPDNFRIFNIYKMSSWSRAIVVPLSVIWASKPSCPVPDFAAIPGLHVRRTEHHVERTRHERRWRAFFTRIDHWLKRPRDGQVHTPARQGPGRLRAVDASSAWPSPTASARSSRPSSTRSSPSAASATRWTTRGWSPRSGAREARARGRRDAARAALLLAGLGHGTVIEALSDAGLPPDDPILLKAGRWLLDREVKEVGDWKKACPAAEPGGWYFEYANEWYPDIDDTAEVLMALSRVRFGESEDLARQGAVARGQAWMLAMQNRDGGWGAFDKDNDSEVLTQIPFADHNAMIDPSTRGHHRPRARGVSVIGVPPRTTRPCSAPRTSLTPSSCPTGRGTAAGAATTSTARASPCAASCTSARTCASHASRRPPTGSARTRTPTAAGASCRTPTTTRRPRASGPPHLPDAWALVALFATGDGDSESVHRGIDYLLGTQQYDGSWKDDHWTATGFPKVFYFRYHLYATYFRSSPSRCTRARPESGRRA